MLTRDGHEVVAASRRSGVGAVAGEATGTPVNETVEIGGPEPFHLDGLIQRVVGARGRAPLKENEFRISEVPPGSVLLMGDVAIVSVEGGSCATQAMCTHRQGPWSEGTLDGSTVTCPLHGAQFNVWTGAVLRGLR